VGLRTLQEVCIAGMERFRATASSVLNTENSLLILWPHLVSWGCASRSLYAAERVCCDALAAATGVELFFRTSVHVDHRMMTL